MKTGESTATWKDIVQKSSVVQCPKVPVLTGMSGSRPSVGWRMAEVYGGRACHLGL